MKFNIVVCIFFLYFQCQNTELMERIDRELRNNYYELYEVQCVDSLLSSSGTEQVGFTKEKAFGPPTGAGNTSGSLDVFVIGEGEEAIFYYSSGVLVNNPGIDFKIFENSFETSTNIYSWDLGFVEVSKDGNTWYGFEPQHDQNTATINLKSGKSNLVGLNTVITNYKNHLIDPRLENAGGDGFDLSEAKLIANRVANNPLLYSYTDSLTDDSKIKYIKIIDGGSNLLDNQVFSNGVDIDAICFLNFE